MTASGGGAKRASQFPKHAQGAPEKYFDFLGLVIVRKADLLAATAFLLAAGSAAYQAGSYIWGAHLSAFAPDNVLVFFDRYADGEIVTRIAGQLTFTNSGAEGRAGTVREAWVDLVGPGIAMRQHWASFPKFARDREALRIDPVDEAFPFQVPGQGTVSKFTGFAPRIDDCIDGGDCSPAGQYVSDTTFLKNLSTHVGESLTLTFQAITFESGKVTPSICKLPITNEFITYLGANDWFIGRCVPAQQ
jgi:hypothetical protein